MTSLKMGMIYIHKVLLYNVHNILKCRTIELNLLLVLHKKKQISQTVKNVSGNASLDSSTEIIKTFLKVVKIW